jgi:hypothetical protein
MPPRLREHAQFAAENLQRSRMEIDALMTRFQLSLADRQCAMSALSHRIQSLIVMFTTCLYAAKQQDELIHGAAEVLCLDLRREFTGKLPSANYFKTVTQLGKQIASGGFKAIAGVEAPEILMPYKQ